MIEEVQAKSILNPTGGFLSTYTHSLNAYQGCAFGKNSCPYCYVRASPVQRFSGKPWGEWVKAKINAPELLRQELEKARRKGTFGGLRIFMSTATDPYQGAEARLKLTRGVLEVFAMSGDFGLLVVQTRSPLIERDIDLLTTLGSRVWVSLTVETNREEVRRQITPASPSIARRLATLERLTAAGIRMQAAISPVLPCDAEEFAALIAPRANRAVVDTLIHGDGANGRRSAELGMPELLRSLGYAEWLREDAHIELLAALRRKMGTERVGFSQEGFNLL
ncbi:MAG TPA: radical SAM protein [Blastocatellia bacterium]|nr:radical SAM protein [Blastocatellia bacterium]HMY71362.1 radical SAM protein [Blastocatellia bacterium]HMZ19176.1 radical SAM protein [Blastocatellia bacterium]HNG32570.1 radical SAM protein [Blastocatellia bacterium]